MDRHGQASALLAVAKIGPASRHLSILQKTRSGPKIPAAGLFGGRLYFVFGESRDNSVGFELLDAFLPIKTR